MVHRLLLVLVLAPIAIILIALAASNRTPTPFTIDPFNPGNPALTMVLPLFAWLFAALVIGVVLGSCATWLRQGRYRRAARESSRKVAALRGEKAGANTPGTTPALGN